MSSGRTDTSARHRQVARYGDDGSGTPELVVVLPVLMLLVTVCLQFALWALASNALSDSVAQAGASLRAEGGTSAGRVTSPSRRSVHSQAAWCCARRSPLRTCRREPPRSRDQAPCRRCCRESA